MVKIRLWMALGVLCFGVFLAVGRFLPVRAPNSTDSSWQPTSFGQNRYIPDAKSLGSGESEIVMVYIGSSTCGFSNDEALPPMVENTKRHLQHKAQELGFSFLAVGVAVDWDISNGIKHLEKFGFFDEIAIGGKWQGLGAQKYFGGNFASKGATPQILIYVRRAPDAGISMLDERLLVRKSGVNGINAWIERGYPVPLQKLLDSRTQASRP